MATFQQENDALLYNTINKGFIEYLQFDTEKVVREKMGIELYITPECNQNCSYCYLCAHGDELYPKEIRDRKKIIENYKLFLDYCVENKLKPQHFDLFSGEIWQTQFGIDILEIMYEYLDKQQDFMPESIMIPSNCSFVASDKALERVENILQKFKDNPKITTRLFFSCSNDGYHIDNETRPLNDPNAYAVKKGTKGFYDRLLGFCKKWGFGFHPMVSAHGIEKWPENFKWWCDELEALQLDPIRMVMMLETRNDNWTEDKLISYMKFLNYQIDYIMELFSKWDKSKPAIQQFIEFVNGSSKKYNNHYNSLRLQNGRDLWPTCSIARTLTVRLGDLAIVPCHRMSYDEFLFGHFKVEEGKIIGVTSKNVVMMNQIWLNNLMGAAKCGSCPYNTLCTRGCYGSQFESNGEFLYPCDTVCDLYKVRTIFLYHKYDKLGIWADEKARHSESYKIIDKIKETEEFEKWSKIVRSII